jgi:hypothetical protein
MMVMVLPSVVVTISTFPTAATPSQDIPTLDIHSKFQELTTDKLDINNG